LEGIEMGRNADRLLTLSVIAFITSCCLSACSQDTVATSTTTHPVPTPTGTSPQPAEYHLRIDFTSTSDWAELTIPDVSYVLSVDLGSVSGTPSYHEATETGLVLQQSLDDAEGGNTIGIVADYQVNAEAGERGLAFQIQKGSLNGCTVRTFRLLGDEYQLVHEVDHQDVIGTDGKNTLAYVLDLNALAEIPVTTSSTTQPTPSPSEVGSIIFHNGVVLTLDEDNTQSEALAIKDNLILAVGSDEGILAHQGPETIVIDLDGRTLLPGFVDGHTHILMFPDRMGRNRDEAIDVALSLGLTSLTEMVGETDFIDDLLRAEAEGRMRVRVNVFTNLNKGYLNGTENIIVDDSWIHHNDPILDHDLRVRVPGVKIFVDGAGVPQRGCPAMSQPYSAETQAADWFKATCFTPYGDLYWEQADLNAIVADAQEAGYRVAFHAMGDRAIEVTLNAIEHALDGQPNDSIRHQVQHSSILRPDLMDRYVALDAITSLRGYFNTCDQVTYENDWAANRYSLPGLGVHTYMETDFGWTADPVDVYALRNSDPIMQLYGMVTHQQIMEDGTVCEPADWLAQHAITVEQALRIMTIEGAYAVSQEEYLGSLQPGKFADMIILSDNPYAIPPEDLKGLRVWMTMVDGVTEYCKPGYEAYCP
jgi:predicted amidohydrolase YtcJ